MAIALVRSALYSVKNNDTYFESKRIKNVRLQIDQLLSNAVESEHFDRFAGSLHGLLEDQLIKLCMPISSESARKKLWEKYHRLRSSDIIETWTKFYDDMGIEDYDVLVAQMTTDQLLEDLVKFHCTTDTSRQTTITKRKLSDLEENVIRYASGYIPRSLMKRFKPRKEKKYADFMDCLLSLSADSDDDESTDTSFYEYTKRWIEVVNRGGLFETNEVSYMLFRAIESTLQPHIQSSLLESAKALESDNHHNREYLIGVVMSDEEVLFHWSLCSLYIIDEDDCKELLKHIVGLWLTIRGYSLVNEWVEKFKWEKKSSSAKEKSLRKTKSKKTTK